MGPVSPICRFPDKVSERDFSLPTSPHAASEMEVVKVSTATMLEDEISWLDNFEPSWSSEMETSEADNILLAGHLRLIKTLLSLCGNEKEHLGECRHACVCK